MALQDLRGMPLCSRIMACETLFATIRRSRKALEEQQRLTVMRIEAEHAELRLKELVSSLRIHKTEVPEHQAVCDCFERVVSRCHHKIVACIQFAKHPTRNLRFVLQEKTCLLAPSVDGFNKFLVSLDADKLVKPSA